MATVTWTGGAADGNWQTGGNWSGGAAPSAADDVIINSTAYDITTGPASAIALASLFIGPRYTGKITATIALGTVTVFTYLSGGLSGKFNLTAPTAIIDIPRGRWCYLEGGTWGGTHVLSGQGNIQAASAATVTNVVNGLADWTIYSSATKITSFYNAGGHVVTDGRNIGAYTGTTGSWLRLRSGSLIADGSSGGLAVVGRNATLSFEGTGGTHDGIHAMGSVLSRDAKSAQTVTSLWYYPGSVVEDEIPGLTMTVTNAYKLGGGSAATGLQAR